MNFIKRAFLGVTRKKGKSLILLAVIFILGNLISGAISIQQATGNVESTIKERLGAAATVDMDYKAWESMSEEEMETAEMEELGVDLIEQIGELPYVKYYDYNMSNWFGSESLEPYQEETDEGFMEYEDNIPFNLKGINYAPVIDFEEGKGELADGRVFTDEEIDSGASVAIISQKLAEQNNLEVGDTFTLLSAVYDYSEETDEEEIIDSRDVVLEVIGLFDPQSGKEDAEDKNEDSDMFFMEDFDYQNTMYVPNEIILAEEKFLWEVYAEDDPELAEMLEEESMEYYMPIYYLNNPEDIEPFEEEVAPLLPELYTVISASDQYDDISGPMESMSTLSKYVLLVAIIATILITGLVVLLFLRDRKRELGIYLSLGEKRGKVVGQILIEVLAVAVIGITLSLFTGNLLAGQVSDTMMKADDNQEEFYGGYYYEGMENNLTVDDVMDSYEVSLNSSYVLGFYGIGLLTILISTIIPLIYIVRLNPKKILM
ncbi:ABC transporter permease [Oceanobacillus jeddahense]|uniref:ABC transporter permease n=1 Tax=Oceanobacillus jeddahense TaxID=1462527 RepID=A0ABY5JYQ8_9BACI|nr:FtsX-like permease family protein [Oceanobacillus jeddahense]UUI04557.1 ABC transporter permease [Oceanobacillus jeddahense]